ncbi:hypothetical protein WJX72_011636 [[Myrmecia] bisecta]|uniref:Glutamine cyclotransferase n=1 Tax=[Myrmecia] bisecta TaxID=41462 RepID=A0AAW1P6E0_9CHLO
MACCALVLDIFWESTGMYGESTIREVEVTTGVVTRSKALAAGDFGEGLTKLGDRLFQVNWQVGKTYSYDPSDFNSYITLESGLRDGWGLTADGPLLVFSDGSNILTWKSPDDMVTVRSVSVTDDGKPVRFLNELEWVEDEVWANVWQTECIARIDPASGSVRGWILMHGLCNKALSVNPNQQPRMDVLNGIAYDSDKQRLFVTGKYWPQLYEINVVLKSAKPTPEELAAARRQCIV